MFWTLGPTFQCPEVLGVIPPQPAIESLGTDVKMPAGKTGIPPHPVIVIKPLQPFVCFGRDVCYPFPYGDATGNQDASYVHDTIIKCHLSI